jgi:hypothetical protein
VAVSGAQGDVGQVLSPAPGAWSAPDRGIRTRDLRRRECSRSVEDRRFRGYPDGATADPVRPEGRDIAKGEDFEALYLDNAWQGQTLDSPAAVNQMIRRWEFIQGEALPRLASLELIERAAKAWRHGANGSVDQPE